MKKFLVLTVSFLAFGLLYCHAQSGSDRVKGNSLLWEISGNGLESPSYLFGTIHMICPENFVWTKKMKKALDQSAQIALEMDLSDSKVISEVATGMMLSDGKTLKDFFSPEDYLKVIAFAKDSLKLPEMVLHRMQPFTLMSMSMMKSKSCKDQEAPVAYEQKLISWAKEDNKKIIGLEEASEQLAVIDGLDQNKLAKQLIQMIDSPQIQNWEYEAMTKAFTHQNLNKLYQQILASPDMKADLNAFLFDRNKKWIPRIEKLIKDKPTFIAVGAGHLGGSQGVITLMKEAGYKVKPVKACFSKK